MMLWYSHLTKAAFVDSYCGTFYCCGLRLGQEGGTCHHFDSFCGVSLRDFTQSQYQASPMVLAVCPSDSAHPHPGHLYQYLPLAINHMAISISTSWSIFLTSIQGSHLIKHVHSHLVPNDLLIARESKPPSLPTCRSTPSISGC